MTSDPLQWTVPPLARLSVGTRVPERTRLESFHWGALQTIEVDAGKRTDALPAVAPHIDGRLFLNAVLVDTGGGPPVFSKDFLSTLKCVAPVAR